MEKCRYILIVFLLALAAAPSLALATAKKPVAVVLAPAPATELLEPGERIALAVLSSYRTGVSREHVRHTAKTLVRVAEEKGVDPFLVLAIIRIESSGWNHARSSADARGLMQLRPFVGKALAAEAGVPWKGADTLHQPEINVTLGIHYVAQMLERYDGDVDRTLQAYSMGPTRLDSILARGKSPVRDYAVTARWFADRYRSFAEEHGDLEPGISRFTVDLAKLERQLGGKPKNAYAIAIGDAKKALARWNRTSASRTPSTSTSPSTPATVARISEPGAASADDARADSHQPAFAPLAADR